MLDCMKSWYEQHIAGPQREAAELEASERAATKKRPLVYLRAMGDELAAIKAISPSNVTYVPGIGTKRFARQIQGATMLTAAQLKYIWQIVWRYRRQIDDKRLVRIAELRIKDGVA